MKKLLLLFLCMLSITAMAQIPTDGLVAYYPFNGNANDESGNGKLPAVFGMEKKKIVGKDKNNDSDHGKNDARARSSKRQAEIFEGFFENE